jgi:hypothetical protein
MGRILKMYKPLSNIFVTDILEDLKINSDFSLLDGSQQKELLITTIQQVCDSYNKARKPDYLVNTSMARSGIAISSYSSDEGSQIVHDHKAWWDSMTYDTPGTTIQLHVTYVPSGGAASNLLFSSGDESIATVDENGLCTKIKAYSYSQLDPVTITVTATDSNFTDYVVINPNYPS